MPKKQFYLEGVGPVIIAKRRGTSSLRLSVKPNRQVNLTMPYWTPYLAGERFLLNRRGWIKNQLAKIPDNILEHGDGIGKYHRLYFVAGNNVRITVKLTPTEITLRSSMSSESGIMQHKALSVSEKALKMQCERLLTYRIHALSRKYDLKFSDLRYRKLSSRWGSCSSQQAITLNIFLIQLPWHLIDYVLTHELAHLRHLDHSQEFWQLLLRMTPDAKQLRREIKKYSPSIMPVKTPSVA